LRRGACRYDQAFTGFGQVDGSDAEKESDGGDDFKIDKAFPADAADLAEVTVAGDAGDESAEDERRDNQLDEAEENVAQDAELRSKRGKVEAELETSEHGEENPESEGAFAEPGRGQGQKAEAAEDDEGLVTGKENRQQAACEEQNKPSAEKKLELAGGML
jgi:hypothetical protein